MSVTLAAAMSAGKELVDLADKTGLIESVKSTLVRQPDKAAARLAAVLDELSKIYAGLDSELGAYLSLSFYDGMPPETEREARKVLLEFEGGASQARVAGSRGHCSKIWNIYTTFLDPWFQRVLSTDDNAKMRVAFKALEDSDGQMIKAMETLADWLRERAEETRVLLDSKNKTDADGSVLKASSREVLKLRRELADTVKRLRYLQADFIAMSGVT